MLWAAAIGLGFAIAFAAPMRAGVPAEAPKSAREQRRCQQCHTIDPAFSHPVGVRPGMTVPSHLPLDQGRIACTTCHLQVEHSGTGAGPMLRPTIASESFCTQCHEPSQSTRSKAHASGIEKAHLRARPARLSAGLPTGHLDDESIACVGCHDGATARDIGSHASMAAPMFSGPAKEHPVGVAYRAAKSGGGGGAGSEIRLVEPLRLDPRIRLFDQSVGCGSCHSVYSGQERLLVMSNQRSRLCLACHVE